MYEFGEFRLDEAERLLSRRGVTVPLTPKAFDLLLALVDQPGRLLDKETLLSTLWPDSFVEENNLADNIFKLRRVLGDGENGRRFIETVPKRGYRFVADVRAVAPLTAQGPELAPQVVAEPPRQAEAREGQVPLPATNTRRLVTVPWLVAAAMTLLVVALWIGQIRRGTPDPAASEGVPAAAGRRQLRRHRPVARRKVAGFHGCDRQSGPTLAAFPGT